MLYNTTKNNDCLVYLLIFEQKIKTYFIMKTQSHYLVFDGTSHYVVPEEDFDKDAEELIQKYSDFDYACRICDELNDKCSS